MSTFLFVHGAFQGGWVWRQVAGILARNGHDVHTPTLSGCGYLSPVKADWGDLGTYIDEVVRYVEMEDLTNVILVAHSFSGMICSAVMMRTPARIRHAVFVDAMIPEQGRSFADIAGEPFMQMLQKHRSEDGSIAPWPLPVFGVNGDGAQWFAPRLRPFPGQAFTSPFPDPFDPHRVRTSYISCQETMSPFIRAMAGKAGEYGWPMLALNSGHCPMVTCPANLVKAIVIQAGLNQDVRMFFE